MRCDVKLLGVPSTVYSTVLVRGSAVPHEIHKNGTVNRCFLILIDFKIAINAVLFNIKPLNNNYLFVFCATYMNFINSCY